MHFRVLVPGGLIYESDCLGRCRASTLALNVFRTMELEGHSLRLFLKDTQLLDLDGVNHPEIELDTYIDLNAPVDELELLLLID